MEPHDILQYALTGLPDTVLVQSWGESAIFYNPGHARKRGVYVLTVKERDGANDRASRLDRPGVFRVNLGLRRETFVRLFGPLPARPPKGGVVEINCDFSAADMLLPHPVYAWMGWACVLNPSRKTWAALEPLVRESYDYAKEKFLKGR